MTATVTTFLNYDTADRAPIYPGTGEVSLVNAFDISLVDDDRSICTSTIAQKRRLPMLEAKRRISA